MIYPGKIIYLLIAFSFVFFLCCTENLPQPEINSGQDKVITRSTVGDIPVPDGYIRVDCEENSFGAYLRNLELNTGDNTVYLYNGEKKRNQTAQFAIIKMDVGDRDLQQCADAVMRLRAEYLYHQKQFDKIHFNFLSDGKPRYYKDYAGQDTSYKKFRQYMNYIFAYANTASLSNELVPVNLNDIEPGDVLIQKGKPYGHAVTVIDVAVNNESGEKIFMIAQSYMPAQSIHVLKNPKNTNISPWYYTDNKESIVTPEWIFSNDDLKRFAKE